MWGVLNHSQRLGIQHQCDKPSGRNCQFSSKQLGGRWEHSISFSQRSPTSETTVGAITVYWSVIHFEMLVQLRKGGTQRARAALKKTSLLNNGFGVSQCTRWPMNVQKHRRTWLQESFRLSKEQRGPAASACLVAELFQHHMVLRTTGDAEWVSWNSARVSCYDMALVRPKHRAVPWRHNLILTLYNKICV